MTTRCAPFSSFFFLCPAKPRLCHADEPETVVYTGPHTQSKREIFQGTNRFLFLPFFGCLFDRFVVRGGLESEAEFFYFTFSFGNKFYFLDPERTICMLTQKRKKTRP